jgi:hypothetical protein
MIYIPIFTKFGIGVQVILKICFKNLRDCNVDITDNRDLRSAPLKLARVG